MENDSHNIKLKRPIDLNKSFKKTVMKWHRSIGIIIAVFILIFTLSGISLNHTNDLQLDKKFVTSPFLLSIYGIELPENIVSFPVGSIQVAQLGEHTYFQKTKINSEQQLVGATTLGNFIVIAFSEELLLLSEDGELIDQIDSASGLPENIISIGADSELVYLETVMGTFSTDSEFLEWQKSEKELINWATPGPINATLKNQLAEIYRGDGLNYERVLLDIHSGRIAGQWGVWLMDLAAILLIVMSLSGIILWVKSVNKNKTKRLT